MVVPSMNGRAIAFAAPQIGVIMIFGPIISVLSGVYAKEYGLDLSTIAFVILIARLFDAITDPAVGYISDILHKKTGSRKPQIVFGGLFLLPCAYFLFVPIVDDISVGYFSFWYMAFYFFLTVFTIPYLAWANEFTVSSNEKTIVFGFFNAAQQIGGFVFYSLPFLPFFSTSEITSEVLKVTVIAGTIIFLPGLYVSCKFVPDEPYGMAKKKRNKVVTKGDINIYQLLRGVISNGPFLIFVLLSSVLGVGFGMWAGVFFIFVDTYIKCGEEFAMVSLVGMLFGAFAIPLWCRMTIRYGKRLTWVFGVALLLCAFLLVGYIAPGSINPWFLLLCNTLIMVAMASTSVVTNPMLCDIIDYAYYLHRYQCGASYFSFHTLLTKMQMAVGSAAGLFLIGWLDYDVNDSLHSDKSVIGMLLAVSWVPAVFSACALILIFFYPLTDRKILIVRERLARLDVSPAQVS